jgi:hypothetical protein
VVEEMLQSEDAKTRERGATLLLKHKSEFEALPGGEDLLSELPPGTWIMYPSEYRDDVADGRVAPPAPSPEHTPHPDLLPGSNL